MAGKYNQKGKMKGTSAKPGKLITLEQAFEKCHFKNHTENNTNGIRWCRCQWYLERIWNNSIFPNLTQYAKNKDNYSKIGKKDITR